ncbi:MAG: stage II sporulation protein M [Gammaproteobacteria bacterium]
MKQQLFEQEHQATWEMVEQSLEKPGSGQNSKILTENYMLLSQHLALSKQRLYDTALIERLNKLVMRLYRELYRYQTDSQLNYYRFLIRGFPLSIYRHRVFIAIALIVFLLPGVIAGGWVYLDENAIYSILDAPDVRRVEQMYDPAARKIGREREAETDIFMFGFYIQNNISIAFRCFAGGLLAGLGTLLVLFFNGLHIGSIAGHLTRLDYVDTFYPFVVGHGAFELTAIVFSGAAGLKLGYSILNPGQLSRLNSLRLAGRESIPMLYGIVLMLVIAAFMEAFWSANASLSISSKYTVGAICWLLVLFYSVSGKRFESR